MSDERPEPEGSVEVATIGSELVHERLGPFATIHTDMRQMTVVIRIAYETRVDRVAFATSPSHARETVAVTVERIRQRAAHDMHLVTQEEHDRRGALLAQRESDVGLWRHRALNAEAAARELRDQLTTTTTPKEGI